MAVSEKFFTEI